MGFILNIILWQIGQATNGGIGLGWVYNFIGIMIGSAVIPVSYLLLWSRTPAIGAIAGALVGNVCALMVWIIHASNTCEMDGIMTNTTGCSGSPVWCGVSAKTLGTLGPQLSGNLTAILSSGLICTLFSLMMPQKYDWKKLNEGIKLVEDSTVLGTDDVVSSWAALTDAREWIIKYGVGGTLLILVMWPLCVLPWGVFSKPVYQLWSSIVVAWGTIAAVYIILAPLAENSTTIMRVLTWSPVPKGSSSVKPGEKVETVTA